MQLSRRHCSVHRVDFKAKLRGDNARHCETAGSNIAMFSSPDSLSSDGIIWHGLSPGEYQTQRHYLESGQGVQAVLLQKQEPCKLNAGGVKWACCTCVSCWLVIPPWHPSPEDCMDKHPLFEQDQWQQNGLLVSKKTLIMCIKGETHGLTDFFLPQSET